MLKNRSSLALCILLALCAPFVAAEGAPTYTFLHRILPLLSTDEIPAWSERGDVFIEISDGLAVSATLDASRGVPISALIQQSPTDVLGGRYQVALQQKGNPASLQQSLSIKSCLLQGLAPGAYQYDVLTLVLSSNSSDIPTTVDSFSYDVVGVQKGPDGCPKLPMQKKGGSAAKKEPQLKLVVSVPEAAEQPTLRPPPKPKADGSTGMEEPPAEKSFFQKYWYYILPVLVLLALPSDGGSGGEPPSAGAGARRIQ